MPEMSAIDSEEESTTPLPRIDLGHETHTIIRFDGEARGAHFLSS